jgi:predicted GNAT superfamily acetyltransferase
MRTRLIANLALLLTGLVLSLVMVEAALRLAGVNHARFRYQDSRYGVVLRPNFSDYYTLEGFAYVRTNSQGFRDVERPLEPPPDTIRIAVLGDSFTAALQLDEDKRFTELTEDALQSCPASEGKAIQVMNFGVPGYSTAAELLLFREKVAAYRPDIVVLAFFTTNDIDDNVVRPDRKPENPLYVVQDGQLVLDLSFQQFIDTPSNWDGMYTLAYDHLRLVQTLGSPELSEGLSRLASDPWKLVPSNPKASDDRDPLEASGALTGVAYREPTRDFTRNAWRMTETLLVTFARDVAAHGARFLLVTLSNPPQVYPDPVVRQNVMRKAGLTDLFYADTRIRKFAERNGIPVLTLAPTFQEYADAHKVFLHGFPQRNLGEGHWNQEGHRLAAEMISNKLCQEILPS